MVVIVVAVEGGVVVVVVGVVEIADVKGDDDEDAPHDDVDDSADDDEDEEDNDEDACCRTLTTSNGVTVNAVMILPNDPDTILIHNILLLLIPAVGVLVEEVAEEGAVVSEATVAVEIELVVAKTPLLRPQHDDEEPSTSVQASRLLSLLSEPEQQELRSGTCDDVADDDDCVDVVGGGIIIDVAVLYSSQWFVRS